MTNDSEKTVQPITLDEIRSLLAELNLAKETLPEITIVNKEKQQTLETVFSAILKELEDTFKRKNADYGGSVDITYLMLGNKAQLVRLWDKLLRITQLYLTDSINVKSETVDDTLMDLAAYTVIAAAQRRVFKGDELPEVMKQFADRLQGGTK